MIRVLHVVENFNGQAVESWLTRLLTFEGFDFRKLRFDFFVIGIGQGRQAGAVLEKGCKVHAGNPGGASIPQMAKALRKQVRRGGYDIVHIHQDVMGGIFALALAGTGVKIVTQVHNCWQRLPVGGRLKERVLTAIARQLTLKLSKAIVGVSRQALDKITDGRRSQSRIDRVIYCSAKGQGNTLNEADRARISAEVREQHGLPVSAKVMLFLGRLDEYKNPIFALDVLKKMIEEGNKDACLIVAGVGGLDRRLRELTAQNGVEERVRIIGWIDDPARLLLAGDLLLMPSQEWHGEGLGLAAVEAQACGIPVLVSLSIPEDAMIVPDLMRRVSLHGGTRNWARVAGELLDLGKQGITISREKWRQSAFTDAACYASLTELYSNILSKCARQG